MPFEPNRMKQKIDAGAKHAVTQPIFGKDKAAEKYDPVENLKALHKFYPQSCVYLSQCSVSNKSGMKFYTSFEN
jgi:hypothetical protein